MATQIKEKVREEILSIEEILRDDDDVHANEAGDIMTSMSKKMADHLEFMKGRGNLQDWVENNRIIGGKPFRYDSPGGKMMLGEKDKPIETAPRPYLAQYLNDTTAEKSTIKCRQSEFTESEINENIYLCANRPFTNIRHIFPTNGMAQQMAREKISPAIDNSPKIKELLHRSSKNLTDKKFNNESNYTIEGSWTEYGGRGPSSDKLTFDEYESQNPAIEDIFSESTSHSELARKTRISTPKFPDGGIDGKYKKGCQYEWFTVCPKCGKEQTLDFPDNIIGFFDVGAMDVDSEEYQKKINKVYIGCRFCGAYIDRTSQHYLKHSRWIARKPHLTMVHATYRVSYLMLAWKTGKEILYKYHTFRFLHQFWNEVVGVAYVSPEAQVTREIFEQCQDKSFVNQYAKVGQARNVAIGVDWGPYESYVVVRANGFPPDERKSRVIYVEKIDKLSLKRNGLPDGNSTDHAKRVAVIMDYFQGRILINDANGIGADRNTFLVKAYPTRAYGCFYDTDEMNKQRQKTKLIIPLWNELNRRVTVSRLMSLRDMITEYEAKRIAIPRLDNNIEEFIKHHANLAIERYEDDDGILYEVVGHTGPDHYAHADNYAKIGFDKFVGATGGTVLGVIGSGGSRTPKEDDVHPLLRG